MDSFQAIILNQKSNNNSSSENNKLLESLSLIFNSD